MIFEFADEIEDFIRLRSINDLGGKDTTILAIQPCAQAFLKRRDIPYLNTTNFIGRESHQDILLKSAEIIKPLRDMFDLKDDIGIKEGYRNAFIFYLRHYSLLYILWLIEIIENAVIKIQPEAITAVVNKYRPDKMNCIPVNERLAGIIASKVAVGHGIKCDLCTAGSNRKSSLFKSVKEYTLEILKFFAFYFNLFILSYKSKGKRLILYSSNSYNLKNVIESFLPIFDNAISVVLFERPVSANISKMVACKNRWSLLSSLPYIKAKGSADFYRKLARAINMMRSIFLKNDRLLHYRGIDFSEPVLSKLEKEMKPFLTMLYGQTYHLNNLINKIKPSLIISQAARAVLYNMAEIASIKNIPSFMISHGSHVPPSNRFEDIEWGEHGSGLMDTPYTYLAIQSPWALRYLKEKPSHSIPIITGPLLFTKIADRNQKEHIKKRVVPEHYNKTIIVHAGTPKPIQSSRPYVYETVDEYIENINTLIKVIEGMENIHLIVRFRPANYLGLNDFLELLIKSDCYSVHTEGAFVDYLTISDIIIGYSSTTIEEALQNRIPVLIYDPHNKYCHIKSAMILDPSHKPDIDSCYYVNSDDKLSWAIRWLIENHFSKEIPDSVWDRHIFEEREIVNLPAYFRSLFDR